jgi:hypothetical protein
VTERRTLVVRIVATREDNPWLPDDVVVRRGVTCKPDTGPIDTALDVEVRNALRSLLAFLRKKGLMEEGA